MVTIYYTGSDGYTKRKDYKTLGKAKAYSHRMIGEHPEIGSNYAVSGDGVGKIAVYGATLAELFPERE